MEILSYVVEGALEHRDSMGNGSVIRPGDVQRMTAGTGVTHSEYNHSQAEGVRFLQIWIEPDRRGLAPGYEQKQFPAETRSGQLRLVASNDGRDGTITVHQDLNLYSSLLSSGQEVDVESDPSRHQWLQVIDGVVDLNGTRLNPGDGAALIKEENLRVSAIENAHFLLFDLA